MPILNFREVNRNLINMNIKTLTYYILFGILLLPQLFYAQVDFNKTPDDDLGEIDDAYQEAFFEALKQQAIGNHDRAVEQLKKCLEINTKESVIYFQLGKNYNALKNYSEAEIVLKKAVAMTPDNEWYLDALYETYDEQGNTTKAIEIVEQLTAYHPDYKEDLAKLCFTSKQYDKALALLDDLDKTRGQSRRRDHLRNLIYKATGQSGKQIERLQDRIKESPLTESNYLELIFRYSEANQKAKAYETAQQLLKAKPDSELVHIALYKFYLDDGKTDDAVASMKTVVKSAHIKPNTKVKVLNDFIAFVKQHPEYEADLVEVTNEAANATDTQSKGQLGDYYLAKGDKEKALDHFETAYEQKNDFKSLRNMLLLYVDLKRYNEALNKSNAALDSYPSQPILYLVNGVALNNLNKAKQAVEVLESGLDYIIDDTKMEADFYTQLSIAHTALNNISKAKTFSDKAKQLAN